MVAPAKWVVPGSQKPWVDPALLAKPARPPLDRRLLVSLVALALTLILGALVLRLSRAEEAPPGPGTRSSTSAPPAFDGRTYESENVRLQIKPPAAPEKEESP